MYVVSDFGAVAVLDCQVLTWELYKLRGARDAVVLGFGLIALVIPYSPQSAYFTEQLKSRSVRSIEQPIAFR